MPTTRAFLLFNGSPGSDLNAMNDKALGKTTMRIPPNNAPTAAASSNDGPFIIYFQLMRSEESLVEKHQSNHDKAQAHDSVLQAERQSRPKTICVIRSTEIFI